MALIFAGRGTKVLFGLGWPEWLTIIGLVGGVILTFKMMARASIAYERKRRANHEQQQAEVGKEEQ